MYSIGIDIAGARHRSFHIALIKWGLAFGSKSYFILEEMPLRNSPIVDQNKIRQAAGIGNLEELTKLSFPIVQFLSKYFSASLNGLFSEHNINLSDINIIGIDSPCGFSRNYTGHGRATEKVISNFGIGNRQFPISAQMTPSISCNRSHGAPWFWMFFGMAAFHLLECNFQYSEGSWLNFLENGIQTDKVIEVFPRITIQYIRKQGESAKVSLNTVLSSLQGADNECRLIDAALSTGNSTRNDRADAVIAAFTTLPSIYSDIFAYESFKHDNPATYQYDGQIPWKKEGVRTAVKVK
jgi:hypothetical protein